MGAQNKESLMFDLVCVHYIENVQNWKILRLLSNTFNSYSSLVQGRFPPHPSSCQTDEILPVRFDEEVLIWIAVEQPLKDTSFLSNQILGLCGDLPIYWLQPIYTKGHLLFFPASMHWFIRRHSVYNCLFRLNYDEFFYSSSRSWLRLPCLSADTLVKLWFWEVVETLEQLDYTPPLKAVHQNRFQSYIKKEWSWNMHDCLKSLLLI